MLYSRFKQGYGFRLGLKLYTMKTRDRILQCALLLFNEKGEAQVSTLEIATELGISPGNLYYHFHGKEPIVLELFSQFQSELAPLLTPPSDLTLTLDDYWTFVSLITESMAAYRFLFQDLTSLSVRQPKLGQKVRHWLNVFKQGIALMLAQLHSQGLLISSTQALGNLVEQISLTLLYSLDYQRVITGQAEVRIAVYQVMMLVTTHLKETLRAPTEMLLGAYLES